MSYFESRLKVNFEDLDEIKEKIKWIESLGIRNLILEPNNEIQKIPLDLKDTIKKLSPINIYFRITIKEENLNNFKNKIKKYHNFEDILCVESINKDVQIHAARDSRVDLISFSEQNILKTLTIGVLSLVKQNNSFIEFSLAPIMKKNMQVQSKNFRSLYRYLHMTRKTNVKYIISGNFSELYDFRHPRGLISICHSLLELPIKESKQAFQGCPRALLERVKKH
ncbi:MAG: RNase P subunit p30 family protein [Promethearchaeota archaeon]